jgi:cell division protein ZapB
MSEENKPMEDDPDLQQLEQRVEALLHAVDELKNENQSLRVQQDSLVQERAKLIEKTELARSRVESMIHRLKSMEQES